MKAFRKSNLLILGLIIFNLFVARGLASAQSNDTATNSKLKSPTLFVLDTCPHCKTLLEEMKKLDSEKAKTFYQLEVSDSDREVLYEALNKCNLTNASVPTLFYQDRCFVGVYNALDVIKVIWGYSKESDLLNKPAQSNTQNTTPVDAAQIDLDQKGTSLSEALDKENLQKYKIDPLNLIIILAIPTLLVGGAMYFRKSLKL